MESTSCERVSLRPAMGVGEPTWPDATWIGEWLGAAATGAVALHGGDGYSRARLLVREHGRVRGFVEVPVVDGYVDPARVDLEIAALSVARPPLGSPPVAPAVTVTVSTRNRPRHLATVLPSLLAITHPDLRVLIVDNASDDDASERVVTDCGGDRVRYVREPRPGLSYGRNRALLEADTPVVAFTDDDVVVDPSWVSYLAEAFAADPEVGLVTGMVPTGELRTPAQQYFENQTSWQSIARPEVFRRHDDRPDIVGYPLSVGRYGTGANFAVRRDLAIRLGGFNEALGIGSPAQGGEDLDMFLRVLYAGWALSYAPDALVWHRHRAEIEDLERSVEGYATGWSAWMTSLLENPDIRRDAIRNGISHGGRLLRSRTRRTQALGEMEEPPAPDLGADFSHLGQVGLRSLARGPAAYVRSRRSGRRIRPLFGERSVR